MSDFQPIGLQHKPLFDELLAGHATQSSSDSFGNVFLWDILCRRNVARLGDRLGIEYLCPRGTFYGFPVGRGDLTAAIDTLRLRAGERGVPLRIHGVLPEQRQELESAFPDAFSFIDDRDNYDYLYSLDAMATLRGKKLHGKRNFCNRFEAAYSWRFAPLGPDNFDDCRAMLQIWDAERDGGDEEENQAIKRAMECWDTLGFLGGILYADGAPVAFTMAEPLRSDTLDVHFEKAREDVPGAYPMIAREFARHVQASRPEVLYLNREEDMGLPNLRKAKEEWYPMSLLEKSIAVWKD